MKIDLFAFTQGDTRVISFMSQALGLMAELDTGTDNWRWMGDTRFFLGFLRGRKAFLWVSSAMAPLLKAILQLLLSRAAPSPYKSKLQNKTNQK